MWPALIHRSALFASKFAFRLPISIIPTYMKMGRVVHIIVGINKAPHFNFSARDTFELAIIAVIFFESLSYLMGCHSSWAAATPVEYLYDIW